MTITPRTRAHDGVPANGGAIASITVLGADSGLGDREQQGGGLAERFVHMQRRPNSAAASSRKGPWFRHTPGVPHGRRAAAWILPAMRKRRSGPLTEKEKNVRRLGADGK